MKAKSVLLTVPLAMSALTFLTLPANAVCWSWKPCADYQGYGYGAPTESQAVLATIAGRRQCASGLDRRSGRSARRHGGAGSSRVSGTAEACQEASGDGDRGATTCAGGEAEAKAGSSAGTGRSAAPPPAPAPAQVKAAPPPAPARVPVQQAVPQPPPAPMPAQAKAAPPPPPALVPAQAQAVPQPAPAPKPAPAQAAAPGTAPVMMQTVPGTATMQVIPE